MSKYTKEDIIRMVEEEGVDFIRMQFTDIFGQAKNVAITASQIQKAVNNQISIDGSSIEGFTRIHESDQYLYPRSGYLHHPVLVRASRARWPVFCAMCATPTAPPSSGTPGAP